MTTVHFLAIAWLAATPLGAQNLISARSGLINYAEGKVQLRGSPSVIANAPRSEVRENQVLLTGDGRAEVLLGPGTFLRIAEDSSFRMVSSQIMDTRIEHLTGSILIEIVDLPKHSAVTVVSKFATISLRKRGLYRFDSEPAQVRIYEGQAWVEVAGRRIKADKGRLFAFGGKLLAVKFDRNITDELFQWSRQRAEWIALANRSTVTSLRGTTYNASVWGWNSFYGVFTYIPFGHHCHSPFGYGYMNQWTPPPPRYEPAQSSQSSWPSSTGFNDSYSTVSSTSSGNSGTMASSGAPTAASSSSSAPISRGEGSAGGHIR